MKIIKVIKKAGSIQLLETKPIYGGCFAVYNSATEQIKTGLCLDAANKMYYNIIKKSLMYAANQHKH